MVKNIKAYTDYPLDASRPSAVFEVTLKAYDRNKYATVDLNGNLYEIKAGYLFRDAALKTRFSEAVWYSLPLNANGVPHTKRQVSEYLKSLRKAYTAYYVYAGANVRVFENLKKALKYIRAIRLKAKNIELVKDVSNKRYSSTVCLMEIKQGMPCLYFAPGSTRILLSSNSLKQIYC